MRVPQVYDVFTAQFQFLDSSQSKIRPVIIISEPYGKHKVVAAIPITSKLSPVSIDVAIKNWQEAGLVRASVAQTHRLSTLLIADLVDQIGSLNKLDAHQIKIALKKFLRL